MKLYDIKSELFAVQDLIENDSFDVNEETGEVIDNSELLKEMLSDIELELEDKADGIIYLIKEAKANETALQEEIKRLTERKAMAKRRQESLKDLLDFALGGEKLKTTKFTIFYKNTKSVNIENEEELPADFINVKEVFSPDKKRIKEALENFEEVAGATLKVTKGVQFR